MFLRLLTLGLLCCILVSSDDEDFGREDVGATELVERLKANLRSNLDLPKDEEYEDLRAELLAYSEALKSLVGNNADTRRSLKSTPCWRNGGICVKNGLCQGFHFLTEIPGCKDKEEVCCFTWNKFRTRDMTKFGIDNQALPWHIQRDIGGKGVVVHDTNKPNKKKRKRLLAHQNLESPPTDVNMFAAYHLTTSSPEKNPASIEEPGSVELRSNEDKAKETKRALFEPRSDDDKPIALIIRTGKK